MGLRKEKSERPRPTQGDESGVERDTIFSAGSGRGRYRSGEVEAVRESDPDRAF
jgi:hypothetical protein